MLFSAKSLNTIELPAVLAMLSGEAVSETAKEDCLKLLPSAEPAEVKRRLDETTAAASMMVVKGSPSFSGLRDIRPALSRANLGGSLNTRELLDIAALLRTARIVRGYIADDKVVGRTCIDSLFHALRSNKFLEESISTSITGEDEIADSASSDLADIRRKMRAAAARAREALQKIISSPGYARALQEAIITMRSDRYVVPVKAEFRNAVPGLVHDISATGATLFVEPMGAVKANNELRELAAKEKLEIEKILAELSAQCAEHSADMESDYLLLIRLDVIFARAKLSYKLDCNPAVISENGALSIRHARHPLLPKDTAVPIDLELGKDFDTLIITGPNTGGKTVSLKTMGLLAAMNQCGMHVPADDGSCLPVFSHILADIGDEQSIEQNLSTFSAHMTNIVSILKECDDRSLVLFDELGAGTDPAEGAALAVSIIEAVRRRGSMVAATTHYTELKLYATNEKGVLNASCEFNVETLRPTYRLLLGVPGKSNAFAIASRLGLSGEIISEARERVSRDDITFENTVEKLEQTRLLLEKDREEAARKLRAAEENEKKSARLRAELEVRLEKADMKSRREAEQIIADARETAELVFRELDDMKKRINEQEEASSVNEARNQMRRCLNLAEEKLNPQKLPEKDERVSSREIRKGDTVEIRSMGVKAEVLDVLPDKMLSLRAGIMTLRLKEQDVYLLDQNSGGFAGKNGGKNYGTRGSGARGSGARGGGSYGAGSYGSGAYGSGAYGSGSCGSGGVTLRTSSISREVDIRGMECLEGVAEAERYIDNAVMAKLEQVTIIHGKGTGALRTAIHQMLRKNKNVKSFRLGIFGEGESGVTVVELK